MPNHPPVRRPDFDTDTIERAKTKTKKPSMWNVVMLNDDFTPMDFVVGILMKIFHKSRAEAEAITFQVHVEGKGIAGTYTFEVAEMKVQDAMDLARRAGHPFQCTIEQVE